MMGGKERGRCSDGSEGKGVVMGGKRRKGRV